MNMRWMMTACLSLFAATACDLDDKNIGDETMGADTSDDSGSPGDDCEPGDMVPAADGCNTCTCQDDGTLACTEIACDPDPDPGECEPGTSVPADDGCNTCECLDDGTIGGCTEIDCDPDPGDCEPGTTVPADDGCNTCECLDDGTIGGCTEIACDPPDTDPFDGPELSSCEPETPFDSLVINGVSIDGDTMTVDVAYSGCGPGHPLGGCWDGVFLESFPVQVNIDVAHDDLMEACDAFPSDSFELDLTPLRESYQAGYEETGTIMINLDGWDEDIEFSF